jgi:hypothetical protein
VEARQALRELLPKTAACAILITSRYGDKLSGVRRQELDLFTAEEAREYLSSHLRAGLLAQSGGEATLDAVAQAVDHLPLALELVVSYMQETRQTPAEWLEEWHKSPVSTMSFHDADGVNYPVSLARVWERSVDRLSLPARALLYVESRRFPGVCVHKEAPVGKCNDKPGSLTVTARISRRLQTPPGISRSPPRSSEP